MKTASVLTFVFTLSTALLQAQAVPALISYQGKVVDATGVGLGTGTPLNRKILFRIFDAGTGGTRLWSEEQTVTLSNGEFSVILGQGVGASYNGSPENPRPSLVTIFGGTDRYLEIVVDNGDGALNATDTPITPRQRLISTAFALRAATADAVTAGSDLNLRDANYGLGWYGAGKPFSSIALDGPVLYGAGGGILGSVSGSSQSTALRWTSDGKVGIGGITSPGTALDVAGTMKASQDLIINGRGGFGVASINTAYSLQARDAGANTGRIQVGNSVQGGDRKIVSFGDGDYTYIGENGGDDWLELKAGRFYFTGGNVGVGTNDPQEKLHVEGNIRSAGNIQLAGEKVITLFDANHGLGYYGSSSTAKPTFASVNVNGPVLYGWGGGALGSSDGGQKIAVQWDGSKNVTVGGNLTAVGTISTPGDIITGSYSGGDRFINVRTTGGNVYRSGIKFQHHDGNYGWSLFSDERATDGYGFHIDSIVAGAINTRLFIANDGKTGIGTKAPAEMLEVSGNIKATGNVAANGKTAAVGEETLRLIRGSVFGNGTKEVGSGFTSSRANNRYQITFDNAFTSIPSVTAAINNNDAYSISVYDITTSGFKLRTNLTDNKADHIEQRFCFIVAGPR